MNGFFTMHAQPRDGAACPPGSFRTFCSIDEAGLWLEPLRQRRPVFVNDYAASPRQGLPLGHPSISRFLGLPLLEGERVVAVVGLTNKAQPYDEADQGHAFLLLEGYGASLEQRKAREDLRHSEERLLHGGRLHL